ncbi:MULTISPECIES: type II toxin-antitoxin system Phd/YefM family antitoxin [Planktothricoides]|uniref:Prevent-host-death protein n=2 Tax=Planktothricoides raciborskii TaxID=132608 RepID=A0AAU8JH26_9CYAN|nr:MULTISPECIES: prevent-host-death protein [Planktothricoides]KOR34019.1 prevent-host-death protein [Planktothricoides sp. SR001]MBD2547507.1 prevent-host-death protein [Planktothricoides raciborskii FACHB-1370]MBD2586010.1 prevent-host-death protein [Planktothricoides raciborskii FACHB-1261]
MNKITVEEITQDLNYYLQRAKAGESFVIFQADQPIAKIISAKSEGVLEAFDDFRSRIISEGIDLDGDEIFADVRDYTPTTEKPCW